MEQLNDKISFKIEKSNSIYKLVYAFNDIDSICDEDYKLMRKSLEKCLERCNIEDYRTLYIIDYLSCDSNRSSKLPDWVSLPKSKVLFRGRYNQSVNSRCAVFNGIREIIIGETTGNNKESIIAEGGMTLFIPKIKYFDRIPQILFDKCRQHNYYSINDAESYKLSEDILKSFPECGIITDYGQMYDLRVCSELPQNTAIVFSNNLYGFFSNDEIV